jgi:predicted nucleotidyltransferase
MSPTELLADIRKRLQDRHGDRLRGVILYGSEARQEATPESDVDLLVLLDGPIAYWDDLRANIEALYPLILAIERPIHASMPNPLT